MPATPWKERDRPSYEELERRIQYLRTRISDLRRTIAREKGVPPNEVPESIRPDPRGETEPSLQAG